MMDEDPIFYFITIFFFFFEREIKNPSPAGKF